jgi:hypothetical protein
MKKRADEFIFFNGSKFNKDSANDSNLIFRKSDLFQNCENEKLRQKINL